MRRALLAACLSLGGCLGIGRTVEVVYRVRVLDPAGQPLPECRVLATAGQETVSVEGTTDRNGTCELNLGWKSAGLAWGHQPSAGRNPFAVTITIAKEGFEPRSFEVDRHSYVRTGEGHYVRVEGVTLRRAP